MKLFRYNDCNWYEEYTSADHLILETFEVIRETKKGFYIKYLGKEKFILSGEGKRFAHTTIELALKSYIRRKKRQIAINKYSIKKAKHSISVALKIKEQIDSV